MSKEGVKQIGIDRSAYTILMIVKLEMVEKGIPSHTFSDAIRYLYEKAKECKKEETE